MKKSVRPEFYDANFQASVESKLPKKLSTPLVDRSRLIANLNSLHSE